MKKILKVALGVILWVVALAACYFGLSLLLAKLFEIWNLTASNYMRAPAWAQLLVRWNSLLIPAISYFIAGFALILIGRKRAYKKSKPSDTLAWTLVGTALSMGLALLALALDSMRLENVKPNIGIAQLVCILFLLVPRWSVDVLTKRFLFERCNKVIAYIAVAILTFALYSGWQNGVIYAINALLVGIAGCAIYDKRGFGASVGFQAAWTILSSEIIAFPNVSGTVTPVWEMYSLSEAWLTGGDRGIMGGLWLTLWLIVIVIYLNRNLIGRKKANVGDVGNSDARQLRLVMAQSTEKVNKKQKHKRH